MADSLTVLALGLSAVTLALLVFVIVSLRRKQPMNTTDPISLASTMGEVKSSVFNLQDATNKLLSTVGEIKQATSDSSLGITKIKEVTELLIGSSQARGKAGEMMIRNYIEKLPRELWEEQFYIPGSDDRVDFVLRIYNDGTEVFLPIDAKFSLPNEGPDFAKEANNLATKRANELVKYIIPGKTTGFAVMVIPNMVFYSLTAATISEIEALRVIPCPPEGMTILCNLAVRAHQAVILTQSADRLRTYVLTVDQNLRVIRQDVAKWAKNLKTTSKSAGLILTSIDDMHSALGEISTSLNGGVLKASATDQELESRPLPLEAETERGQEENDD